ncbi:MAG: putative quinol monooxygenase [Clostridia bacterium]
MTNYVIAVKYKIKSDKLDEFIELLREMAKNSLAEPGCLNYEFAKNDNDVFLYEKYKNRDSFEYHILTKHYAEYIDKSMNLIEEKTVDKYEAVEI